MMSQIAMNKKPCALGDLGTTSLKVALGLSFNLTQCHRPTFSLSIHSNVMLTQQGIRRLQN
jgi:hypothetical protein